jgi:hypothetical protein
MGLISKTTNLKSLRFGHDRIHGGNSGQPYIQTPIPEGDTSVLSSQDFVLRGGLYAVRDSAEDVLRLGKYFTDIRNPSGLLFTAKQNLLSRLAVRTQASGLLNEGIYTPLSTLAEAGGVAFGLHVNKQGLNPFSSITNQYSNVINREIFDASNSPDGILKNRLTALYESKIQSHTIGNFAKINGVTSQYDTVNLISYSGGPGSTLGIGNTNIKFATGNGSNDVRTGINNSALKTNPLMFFGQQNHPSSTYFTKAGEYKVIPTDSYENLKRFLGLSIYPSIYSGYLRPSEEDNIIPSVISSNIKNTTDNLKKDEYYTYSQNQIANIPGPNEEGVEYNGQSFHIGSTGITSPGDFRLLLREKLNNPNSIGQTSGLVPNAPIYTEKNIELRVNLGDPGNRSLKNLSSYVNGTQQPGIVGKSGGNASPNSYDKINVFPIYKSSEVAQTSDAPVNDLVKFRIGVIDNDNPTQKTYIHFRAFLNQISDGYSSDWSDTKYIGRGEKFYTYAGFDRKVSLSWTVAAQSKAELIPMYKKLNYLASICAPDYSGAGYMRGNIVSLTIGGYFYEQPGIITGFSYDMNDDNSTWEIGINDAGNYDPSVKELPHMIKVTGFNFIPIHTFVPSLQQNTYNLSNGFDDENIYGAERYIALSNGFKEGQNNYGPVSTNHAVNPPPKDAPPVVPPVPKTQVDPPPFPLLYPKNTSDLTIRQTQGNRDLVNVQLSKIR